MKDSQSCQVSNIFPPDIRIVDRKLENADPGKLQESSEGNNTAFYSHLSNIQQEGGVPIGEGESGGGYKREIEASDYDRANWVLDDGEASFDFWDEGLAIVSGIEPFPT